MIGADLIFQPRSSSGANPSIADCRAIVSLTSNPRYRPGHQRAELKRTAHVLEELTASVTAEAPQSTGPAAKRTH